MSENTDVMQGVQAYPQVVAHRFSDALLREFLVLLAPSSDTIHAALVNVLGLDLRGETRGLEPGAWATHPRTGPVDVSGSPCSMEDIENLVEVLGVGDADEGLAKVVEKASALRVRLGGVLQSLTGDGADDIFDGIEDLEKIAKVYAERPDKGDSLEDFLSDVPNQGQLCELFGLLGVDWEMVGSTPESLALAIPVAKMLSEGMKAVRKELIDFTQRDPTTDLSTEEILRLILADYSAECERRDVVQGRVGKLLRRLAGECGEGLSVNTMLDRIEAVLGPVPEF